MTYEEATAKVGELKERYDSPFDASDKAVIETLYFEVTRKRFVPTTCQQCYHDALIEIYLKLKKEKAMPKQCNYVMKAGFIISCPDFYNGKIFTNENLTDKVAHEYLTKYPQMENTSRRYPARNSSRTNSSQQAATRRKTSTKPKKQARKSNKTTGKTTQAR